MNNHAGNKSGKNKSDNAVEDNHVGIFSLRYKLTAIFIAASVILLIVLGLFAGTTANETSSISGRVQLTAIAAEGAVQAGLAIDKMTAFTRLAAQSRSIPPDYKKILGEDVELMDLTAKEVGNRFSVDTSVLDDLTGRKSDYYIQRSIVPEEDMKDYFFLIIAPIVLDSSEESQKFMVMKVQWYAFAEKYLHKIYGDDGYRIVMDDRTNVIFHKNADEMLSNYKDSNKDFHSAVVNKNGFTEYNLEVKKEGKPSGVFERKYMAFQEVPQTGWVVLATQSETEFLARASSSIALFIIIALSIILLEGGIIFFIMTTLLRALEIGVEQTRKFSQGNLRITIPDIYKNRRDEIGILTRSILRMGEKVGDVVTKIVDVSQSLVQGSAQLSSSSDELSQGSSAQAASVEEVTASIEEMTATIHLNADNATQTEQIAMKSAVDAKQGGTEVVKTVEAMKRIAEKISIIQEIARQTNLLSLNASIEAARAGEQGKGFAVVAAQVQKLADRSQDAAGEISELSKSSVAVAERAGEMFQRIVPDIQKTSDLVSEINAASSEQNSNTTQINSAVQQLNDVVQKNATFAEGLSVTANRLSSEAEELQEVVSFFKKEDPKVSKKEPVKGKRRDKTNKISKPEKRILNKKSASPKKEKNEPDDIDNMKIVIKDGVNLDMTMNDDEDKEFIKF